MKLSETCFIIECYLCDAFEISHFEPLYYFFEEQGADVFFVAEPCERNTSGKWFDYDYAIEQLKKKKLKYKEECNPNAHIAFTTQYSYILEKYNASTKRISLCYGTSFLKGTFASSVSSMEGFDYKLVHGVYDQKNCEKNKLDNVKVRVIGSPRHYGLHREMFDAGFIRESLGIKTEKKILLYMPTWDEHSSVSTYQEIFMELKKTYYIVTKPHHCTYRLKSKREDMKIIRKISDMVLEASYDFERAAFIGDVALVDAKSGAALETCFINPAIKMVWLSPHKNMQDYFEDITFTMAEVINEPEKLPEVIAKTLVTDRFQGTRNKQIRSFFANKDKECLKELYEEIISDISSSNEK